MSHRNFSIANSSLDKSLDNSTQPLTWCVSAWISDVPDSLILLSICLLGILGNMTVIFVVIRIRSMRTVTNVLLVNLAVSDLLVLTRTLAEAICVLVEPGNCVLLEFTTRCITSAIFATAYMVSLHTLLVISVERFLVICKPFSRLTRSLQSKRYTALTVCVVWIFSAVLCFLFLGYGCLSLDSPPMAFFGQYLPIFNFLLVSTVMFVFYSLVIRKMQESSTVAATLRATTASKEHKVAVLCWVTAVVSGVCLLPYMFTETVEFLANYLGLISLPAWNGCLHQVGDYFINANSAINPYIYNMMSTRYRRALAEAVGLGKFPRGTLFQSQAGTHHRILLHSQGGTHNCIQLQGGEINSKGARILKPKKKPTWV